MKFRQKLKAKEVDDLADKPGHLIQFLPGGFYRLIGDKLYTGSKIQLAAPRAQSKFLELAKRAVETKGKWVSK